MCLFGQVEAVSLPQFDHSLHVTLGLCGEAVGVDLLLQTETKTTRNLRNPARSETGPNGIRVAADRG